MKRIAACCFCILVGCVGAPLHALAQPASAAPRELSVVAGKSLVIDSPVNVQRVSVSDPSIVEAVGVSPTEIVLNGKSTGQTSVIVWQQGGNRLFFEVTVRPRGEKKIDIIRRELAREMGEQDVQISMEEDTVYLRGTVQSLTASERAASIATSLGGKEVKLVNLLNVNVPETEPQVLLKVRFADIDRSATNELGLNIFSTGAGNTIGRMSTGQFTPPAPPGGVGGGQNTFQLSDALNVFLFRPDLDLGMTLKALEAQKLVEMLAEPNVLAANGKEASFLAGGEYPYPVAQGGGVGGIPIISIQFREFGVRLNFTPYLTSRGTIRLRVAPEVSALDFANGFVYQGFNIPALATRRVSSEIELSDRQSFAIAGLLDNRLVENMSRVPGLANIPLLGKLFQSRSVAKNKSELLVLVTPEIVRPIPAEQTAPNLAFSNKFMKEGSSTVPRTPGVEQTGSSLQPPRKVVPVEVLRDERQREQEQDKERSSGSGSPTSTTMTRSGGR